MGKEVPPARTPAQRLSYFRSRLGALGLDAYWVTGRPDVRYLSGFTGDDSTLLVTPERAALVTDSRFTEQAQEEAEVEEVFCRRAGMAHTVGLLCRQMGLGRLGFTSPHVTHADWRALGTEAGGAELIPLARGPAEVMRERKDAGEVEAVLRALQVAQEAFKRFEAGIGPGRSEKWMAALLEWEMRRDGAEGAAFETICALDERGSLPHAPCTDRQAGPDSPVLVDWGARVGGYNCDLTRLTATGTMPPLVSKLTQVVLEAQEAAFERLLPGVRCCEVDRAARAVVARAGYGRNFGHGLGHGVGLEVHEGPRLGAGEESLLLPGMVVTVEPGIYLPGEAGVRIEDMVLITGEGHRVLSSLGRQPR